MTRIAKVLRATGGERPIDRAILLASIVFIAILAFDVRSTISGLSQTVTIASFEYENK